MTPVIIMSDAQLHFVRDGIHTHLVLPAASLCALVPQLNPIFGSYQWLRIGWGDYHYYGNEQQTKLMGLRALLLPTSSVVALLGIDDLRKRPARERGALQHLYQRFGDGFSSPIC